MKLLISLIILFSLLFLFGGLFSVGIFTNGSSQQKKIAETKAMGYVASQPLGERYTMKQIDSITSVYNYPFTSANAENSSVYSIPK